MKWLEHSDSPAWWALYSGSKCLATIKVASTPGDTYKTSWAVYLPSQKEHLFFPKRCWSADTMKSLVRHLVMNIEA